MYNYSITKCFFYLFNRHEAERLEQEAKGRLERQKIIDEAEAEKARKELLELQANSAAVESTGQAKAEAQSRAEAARIEGEAAVEQAKLKAEASKIDAVSWNLKCYISIYSFWALLWVSAYQWIGDYPEQKVRGLYVHIPNHHRIIR